VFKELGLSNEQANKLMPVVGEYAKRIVAERDEKLMGTILEQRKDWLETARKDPEIGGNNWDATMREGARALDQLGFPKGSPLRNALDESGFGNHPEMIRFAAKVEKPSARIQTSCVQTQTLRLSQRPTLNSSTAPRARGR
jgi:hypothetical protein